MPNFEDLKVGDLVYGKSTNKAYHIDWVGIICGEIGISVNDVGHNIHSFECCYNYEPNLSKGILGVEDVVSKPTHYNKGKIECIDAIESALTEQEYIGFLKGTSLKYHWRAKHKGNEAQDMQKAKWYLDRLNKCLTKE